MRNLSLNLAAIFSLLGAVAAVIVGVVLTAGGSVLYGLSLLLIGTPLCLAWAVVFDYISERIRRDAVEGNFRGKADVIDTPWENDPEHGRVTHGVTRKFEI